VDSELTTKITPHSHPVEVYNKVTNGAHGMREGVPAYLSTSTQNFCILRGCALQATDMDTGTFFTAECQTEGTQTTNGNNTNDIYAHNPGRFTSMLW
jgi:hypothetical protein